MMRALSKTVAVVLEEEYRLERDSGSRNNSTW